MYLCVRKPSPNNNKPDNIPNPAVRRDARRDGEASDLRKRGVRRRHGNRIHAAPLQHAMKSMAPLLAEPAAYLEMVYAASGLMSGRYASTASPAPRPKHCLLASLPLCSALAILRLRAPPLPRYCLNSPHLPGLRGPWAYWPHGDISPGSPEGSRPIQALGMGRAAQWEQSKSGGWL
ncbi:unnamed protein product [Lota lota]